MKAEEKEILFIYNSEKQEDRKARGYAETVDGYALNDKDVSKVKITETQIAEIADDMGVTVVQLVDENSEYYMNELKDKSIDDSALTTILSKNPEALKTPIAYLGKKAFFVDSAYSFVKQGIEIEGVKSDKGNAFEKPVESRNL